MKQTFHFLFLIAATLVAAPRAAKAQCTTNAGTLTSTSLIGVCQGANFSVQSSGDAVLDGDDALVFVVADVPGLPLGNVLATSPDGQFVANDPLVAGVTYYVFAAAGNDNGSGGVDWTDPCLSVSPAAPLQVQATPVVSIAPPSLLTCFTNTVTLIADGSNGPQFEFNWSYNGVNLPGGLGSVVDVDQPGLYCVTVTNSSSNCLATVCVAVQEDASVPVADAGPDQTLTCNVFSISLDGFASSTGPEFIYQWTTFSGNIVAGANSLTPVIDAPGQYCLIVTDVTNGCTATDCVNILQDITPPAVAAGSDVIITCANATATLAANAPDGPSFTYLWSGPGIFGGNFNVLNPPVNQPGTYCIVVTNTVNGCTAMDCVNVLADFSPPTVFASASLMSCSDPQAILTANAIPPNTVFDWLGPTGFTTPGPTTLAIPGLEATYSVTATNTGNGCTATTSVQVLGDSTMPRVDAVLTPAQCGQSNGSVSLTPNPAGQQLTFLWSNASTNASLTNLDAGLYFVTITDTQTSCSKTVLYQIVNQGLTLTSTVTQPLCFGMATGAVSITVQGGTAPFEFLWSTGQTTQTATGLAAGVYSVSVIDALNCTATLTAVVTQPTLMTAQASIQSDCNGLSTVILVVSGGTPPYSFSWNSGNNGPVLNDVPPGVYSFTITDANGCALSSVLVVTPPPPLQISSSVSSTCFEATVLLTPTSGGPNLTYQWSDGSNLPLLTTSTSGTYTVMVTDLNTGCTAVLSFDLVVAGQLCATVKGRVVNDFGLDCVADAGEDGLSGWIVEAVGQDTFYAATNALGEFNMGVLPGNYQLQVVLPNALWTACAALPVSLASPDDTVTADLPVKADILCPALTVDISTPQLRRCFSNNFYYVNYCNEGPTEAPDAYVEVTLDPFLSPLSSNQPYTALGNNVFRFNLGTVAPGDCGAFWMKVFVGCNTVLGQTHCTEAHIFPDTICSSNPNWSGASIVVNAVCDGDSVRFAIKNAGVAPMSASLDYIVIEDGIMLMQAGAPALSSGDSVEVVVPANGATWRVEAMQEPFHPQQFLPAAVVEGCTVTGSFSTGYVNQFPAYDSGPALDVDCTANIGSYDPNDKQGYPFGYGPSHYVTPGTDLEYLVRFQNTGTDTAFTVVVRDTLSGWLDPATVQPGASSHPYRFDLSGEGVVIFTFDDILLPDSNVNEAASHGFVRFRIAQKTGVPLETDIFNRAAIYFDFNDPVLTNTTVHRVGENFIATGIFAPEQPETRVRILPNPFEAVARVELTDCPAGQRLRVSVVNSTGRIVREETAAAPSFTLNATGLPPGLYFLKIETAGGRTGVAKFVLR